jgi:LacI family transcriptional regulator
MALLVMALLVMVLLIMPGRGAARACAGTAIPQASAHAPPTRSVMTGRRLTIQDVADRVGLSKFSVSRALSGKPGVGEATRERVMQAAHEMGYRIVPERDAAAARQILFVRQELDPVSSELWLNIMHGAEREAERLGFAILPRQARTLGPPEGFDAAIAGLILAVPRPADFSAVIARARVPIVLASYAGPLERVDHVLGADWEAGFAVAEHLLALGHRDMVFVHGSSRPLGRAERYRGFRDGAERGGASVADFVFDEAMGFREPFLAWLREDHAPTALFCAHDGIAVTVVSELLRLGVRVPEEVSVVGFNDFAAARQISPRLTTVRTPQVEIGAAMVRCIADRLGGPGGAARPPSRLALVGQIVERESTARAGGADWATGVLERGFR